MHVHGRGNPGIRPRRHRPGVQSGDRDMGPVSVGVDIGQKVDPTAIVVCEAERRETGRMVPPTFFTNRTPRLVSHHETRYEVRHMERLPLGTPYPAVATRIAEVIGNLRMLLGVAHLRVTAIVDVAGV